MWTRDLEAEMSSAVMCLCRSKFISSGWQCHFNSWFNKRHDLNLKYLNTLRVLCLLGEIILWCSAKASYSPRTRMITQKCRWQSGWMCSPGCCTEQGIQECVTHLCWVRTTPAGKAGVGSLSMEKIKDCSPWSTEVLQVERGPVPSYIISLNANSSCSAFSSPKPFTNPV